MLIHLSTTSDLDLTQFDDPELPLRFERIAELNEHEGHLVSRHPHKWHLTRWGGCSCHFREAPLNADGTVSSAEIFCPVPEWMEEDPDNLAATHQVYEVIQQLLEIGAEVDCVQVWNELDLICHLDVSLSRFPKEHFSFAEDYCYHIVP